MSFDPDRMSPSDPQYITGSKKAVDISYPMSLFNQHRRSLQTPEVAQHYRREQKRDNRKNRNRYRTQPITFDEIKEVDEETVEGGGGADSAYTAQVGSLNDVLNPSDLRLNFLEFSKNLQEAVARKISTTTRQNSAPYGGDSNSSTIIVVTPNKKT